MANLKDRSSRWPSHIAEKFEPPSFWTEDANGNYLLEIHLPGFKHEEVRIELPSAGQIKIEGERIMNENKCIYFDNTFPLPENSDIDNIAGKFEEERLLITVPKITLPKQISKEEDNDDESENDNKTTEENAEEQDNHRHVSDMKGKCEENNQIKMVIKYFERNKEIVLSIVVSFLIGVWVSNLGIK